MTCDSAPSPNPSPASGRRTIAGLALCALLVGGCFAATAVPVHAARPLDCVTPVLCPTVSVPTLPTVSLPLPTIATTTTSTQPTPTTTTTDDPPRTSEDSPQQPSAAFLFTLRTSVHARQHRRWVELRLSLSQDATLATSVLRSRAIVTTARYAARAGSNRFNLTVPARAKGGAVLLTVDMTAGTTHRRVVRRLFLPSR
jgi:hypothetical protein